MKMESSYSEQVFPFIPETCRFDAGSLERDGELFVQSLQDASVGFAVVKSEFGSIEQTKAGIIGLMTSIASPIVVYKRHGLWKRIGVDVKAQPSKVEGTGIIPLHIDCINTAKPPDYVAFLCTRSDPRKGGNSLVASFSRALAKLTPKQIDTLRQSWVREGKFFDLENVGAEFNPFPILECPHQRIDWVRYTAKPHSLESTQSDFALEALTSALIASAYQTELKANEVLILNQRLVAHGRLALGNLQDQLRGDQQRELFQVFFRDNGLAASAGNIPQP
jgi:alpha-ketoglutarate-dependent taurine dioxygenase